MNLSVTIIITKASYKDIKNYEMFSIDTLEKVVDALSKQNLNAVKLILLDEHELAKSKGKHNVAQRIENLINRITTINSSKGAASAGVAFKNVPINFESNKLVETFYPNTSLEQMVLSERTKQTLRIFIREWKGTEKLKSHSLDPANKIIIYGPPGTGKTMLAHAISNQLQMPLVLVRLDELISSLLGRTGKNIKDIFEIANKQKVVLFLDEIDTIAKYRADEKEQGELKRIVTVLLQNIDFFPSHSILIGATNHDEILDKAIWRRFPVRIAFTLPDENERKLLFELYTQSESSKIDVSLLSALTDGWNNSDIKDLVYLCKKEAILDGRDSVDTPTLLKHAFAMQSNGEVGKNKKETYKACKVLKLAGYTYRQIESITGVPYTTLKDNI